MRFVIQRFKYSRQLLV